jgi:hypothetical protein
MRKHRESILFSGGGKTDYVKRGSDVRIVSWISKEGLK